MRNYIKINASYVNMYYNNGANFTTGNWFWHDDDPDLLLEMIHRFQTTVLVLSWTGQNDVTTFPLYMKLNLQDLLDACNLPNGAGTPAAVLIERTVAGEYPDLLRSIFVEKSPRRKGRHG